MTVVIAVIGFLLWKRGISLGAILTALGKFSPATLGLVLLLACLQILFMILRVWSIIPKHCRIGWKTVAEAISFGQFLNTFVPARAGDVVKVMVVSKADTENAPVMTCAGFILADKIIDLAAIIALVFMSKAWYVATMKAPALSPKLLWLLIPVAALAYAGWKLIPRDKLHKLREWADHFRQGLAALRSPGRILLALLFGIAAWSSEILAIRLLCEAQGSPIDIAQGVFVLCILNLAIAFPVSLANVGTYEGSVVFALGALGTGVTQGIAVGTMQHWAQLVGIGLWALFMGMWRKLTTSRENREFPHGTPPITQLGPRPVSPFEPNHDRLEKTARRSRLRPRDLPTT